MANCDGLPALTLRSRSHSARSAAGIYIVSSWAPLAPREQAEGTEATTKKVLSWSDSLSHLSSTTMSSTPVPVVAPSIISLGVTLPLLPKSYKSPSFSPLSRTSSPKKFSAVH